MLTQPIPWPACSTALSMNKFFLISNLILPWFSLRPSSLILSLNKWSDLLLCYFKIILAKHFFLVKQLQVKNNSIFKINLSIITSPKLKTELYKKESILKLFSTIPATHSDLPTCRHVQHRLFTAWGALLSTQHSSQFACFNHRGDL